MIEKPKLKLTGENGNVFHVLGLALKVGKAAGWTRKEIDKFMKEAMSDDYDNALQTCMKYFDVS